MSVQNSPPLDPLREAENLEREAGYLETSALTAAQVGCGNPAPSELRRQAAEKRSRAAQLRATDACRSSALIRSTISSPPSTASTALAPAPDPRELAMYEAIAGGIT